MARPWFRIRHSGASPQNVAERIRMPGWARGLHGDQLHAERVRDSAGDFVLQREQVGCVSVEPLRP